jgi:serine/threonine-protein kinase
VSDDPRVEQMLDELCDSRATPEEICSSCPELLPQVRERWRQLRRIEAQVDALFPGPPGPSAGGPPFAYDAAALPRVPGYEVEAVLGRGGMGVVYKARHPRLGRTVALKMLLSGPYAGPGELERFLREAETVAGLRHANIVQVHEAGDVDGRPYFTMEYVEGGSLAQNLAGTPQPARQAAALVAVVAEAVHTAHLRGVVHRDLKPANVLLTADGTPKLTDFGLARQLGGAGGLTQSGAPVGTPSYMAPEQAEGKSRDIGPMVDVYALGAILYELLTGRPPFRAETAAQTLQQVIHQAPAPPSRLNASVSRDLETVCLKCLEKDAERRYPSALALAEDLRRWQRGEPVAARPVTTVERMLRWTGRKPTAAGLVLTVLALLGVAVGAGLREWARAAQQRVEVANWEARLNEAVRLQQEGRYPESRAILEQLSDAGPDDLRGRIERARTDLSLVERLDAIRLNRGIFVQGLFNRRLSNAQADRNYEEALKAAGLVDFAEAPPDAAAGMGASNIRRALVAALDDWAVCTTDHKRRWLLEVARRADPDTQGWRDRVRDPVAWADPAVLGELARTASVEKQTVQLLVALGERLQDAGGDAIPLLTRVQQKYPGDFWANLVLGDALLRKKHFVEAARYHQAALALRPGAAVVHHNLGFTLARTGRLDEAIDYLQRAIRIGPQFTAAHVNLANALKERGRVAEAIDHYREALRIDPDWVSAHNNLGVALTETGRPVEGMQHYRQALRIDPARASAHRNLGRALYALGQADEAIDHFRLYLRSNARDTDILNSLALALQRKGRTDEASDQLRRALQVDPCFAPTHNNLGLVLLEQGRLDEAIDHFRQAVRNDPRLAQAHGSLGRALLATGRYREAQTATGRFLDLLPPNHPLRVKASQQLQRCRHMLGLEARLQAVLKGDDRPTGAAEYIEFAELCQLRKKYVAATRLFVDAFAAEPHLADDVRAGRRYNAACAAALAGCGHGDDQGELSTAEQARWREQARRWLRADLASWGKVVGGDAGMKGLAHKNLTHWQRDPDLRGLREPNALDKLLPAERQECSSLWRDVDALLKRARGFE